MRSLLSHVDVIRLDHFRGFTAAWHVPAGAPTAESGNWRPGPGAEFFSAVQSQLGSLTFIAEDLGLVTPDVYAVSYTHLHAVGVGDVRVPGLALTHLLRATMMEADLRDGVDNLFAGELHCDA